MSRSASPISASSAVCPERRPSEAVAPVADAAADDGLCIFAAAQDARDTVALRIGDRAFSFGELADRVRERLHTLALETPAGLPFTLSGTNTLETVVTLYALLQARVPALLLHPRLTDSERSALVDAARRAGQIAAAGASQPAVVLYTSGTTGLPRGAVLSRQALLASARASASNMGWQADDCWLLAMPIARVGGLSILTRCLAARRCVALAPAFDAQLLPQWIEQQRITLLSLVPTMLAQVLDAHPDWTPPPTLRAVQIGGAPASPRLLQRAAARHLPIILTYGCTETGSQVATTPYEMRFDAARHGAGRPLAGVQLRITDGRIEVKGPMLMTGYLGEPARDAQGWFDTGDVGEIDALGQLHVHARRTDLIITGGENVYPGEVERLLEACPGVRAAGVFGLPDETWGQTVAAALVVDQPAPSAQSLLEVLGAQLAPYKRPRRICIVDALPQTAAGKLDRGALIGVTSDRPAFWAAPTPQRRPQAAR